MCGIAGFCGNGTTEALVRMSHALKRRGPDDEGFYQSNSVGFSFRRLSIIDLTTGHQPLSNEDDSIWVMLNGEIYGYQKTRDQLISTGHPFKTKTDTEVIAHAYEQWGEDFLQHLDGMFAIALWDANKKRLILARDRLGKKPLYWMVKDDTLWFASELKALLAANVVRKEIDLQSLALYFRTDAIATPRSIFSGVHKLEPASALAWSNGRIEKTWSFWSCPQATRDVITPHEAIYELREHIDAAVRDRLVADVPLGLFLSGGIDSAVVAESASRQSSTKLQAFTIGFENDSHDERSAARMVAKALDIELHEKLLTSADALKMLDEAVDLLDEPLADASILPELLLARFARSQLTVALTGDGGDELLLGYQHIPVHAFLNRLGWIPRPALSLITNLLEQFPAREGYFSLGFKVQRFARGLVEDDPFVRDIAWRGAVSKNNLHTLLLPEIRAVINQDDAERDLQRRAQEINSSSFWKAWSWGYLRTFLMDEVLVKVDRATMWFGLEARSPLLDSRVVSFILQLPDSYKIDAWKNKRLFKELLRDRILARVLDRPKHGFAVPIAAWLKNSTALGNRLRDLTSSDVLRSQELFEEKAIRRMIAEHARGIDRRKELWALLMFQQWYQRWMVS